MPRPKSLAFVGFKCPDELKADALELAVFSGKTEADIWKEAMEFRLRFIRSTLADYYDLRQIYPLPKVHRGLPTETKV